MTNLCKDLAWPLWNTGVSCCVHAGDPTTGKGIFIHLILSLIFFLFCLFMEVSILQAFLLTPFSLQPCVLNISGWWWQGVSGALPHPLPLKSTAGLSFPLREKSSNLFLKCFLPKYLPFAKPKFQPRNLTTINEPFSCRPPWSAVGISSFESSSQLRPNQHLSKEGRKKYK